MFQNWHLRTNIQGKGGGSKRVTIFPYFCIFSSISPWKYRRDTQKIQPRENTKLICDEQSIHLTTNIVRTASNVIISDNPLNIQFVIEARHNKEQL